jgi:hypothetical protein
MSTDRTFVIVGAGPAGAKAAETLRAEGFDGRGSHALAHLRRWEESGATWRVVVRTPAEVEIALLTCDAGEEVDRLRSADADVLDHVGSRVRSDDT